MFLRLQGVEADDVAVADQQVDHEFHHLDHASHADRLLVCQRQPLCRTDPID